MSADDDDDWMTAAAKKAIRKQQGKDERTFLKLSADEVTSAHMTRASYINLRDGPHAAQKYVRQHLKGYTLDTTLTDEHSAVFVDNQGKVRVAYRGTQHGLTGEDWKTNAALATGRDSLQLRAVDDTLQKVLQKYGSVDLLTGHSKGGGTAFLMGERYGINTHTQDPFIPTHLLVGGKTKAKHAVLKTPTDVVSSFSNAAALRDGVTVKDVKSKTGKGVLGAHSLTNMTGVAHTHKGDTKYAPDSKNKAFLLDELARGKTKAQIAQDLGYTTLRDRNRLEFDFHHLASNPELHGDHLTNAGYASTERTVRHDVQRALVQGVDKASGKVLQGIANVGAPGGLAAIASSIGAAGALHALGSENEVVNEAAIGGISNVSQDVVQGAYERIRAGNHARNVRGALRNMSKDLVQSVVTRSGMSSVPEAHASGATRMSGIAKAAIRSLGRGALSGVVGYGVESALTPGFQALGLNQHDSSVVSRMLGAAAAGAVFGPEAIPIFAAIEGLMIAGEELWHAFVPPPPPTEDVSAGMFGADSRAKFEAMEQAQDAAEQRKRESAESKGREQYALMQKLDPNQDLSLQGQMAAGGITKDGASVARNTERQPLGPAHQPLSSPTPGVTHASTRAPTPAPTPAPTRAPTRSEYQQGRRGDANPQPNRQGLRT